MNQLLSLKELKKLYIGQLESIYSENEIHAIFYNTLSYRHQISKIDFILNSEQQINPIYLYLDLERLIQSEPIQYIHGLTLFFDLKLKVTKDVLIPRPETEELVNMIIEKYKSYSNLSIIDIGTGSGAIAISIAKFLPNNTIYATDFSEKALKICKINSEINGVNVQMIKHDILNDSIEVFENQFDIIVSNPPYIPESSKYLIHKNVLQYEPYSALFVPDNDPILFYKKIIDFASIKLKSKGTLFFETHENFHHEIIQYLQNMNFHNLQSFKDINYKDRFIFAEK
jgi:release factor glutamine methyltransferase